MIDVNPCEVISQGLIIKKWFDVYLVLGVSGEWPRTHWPDTIKVFKPTVLTFFFPHACRPFSSFWPWVASFSMTCPAVLKQCLQLLLAYDYLILSLLCWKRLYKGVPGSMLDAACLLGSMVYRLSSSSPLRCANFFILINDFLARCADCLDLSFIHHLW